MMFRSATMAPPPLASAPVAVACRRGERLALVGRQRRRQIDACWRCSLARSKLSCGPRRNLPATLLTQRTELFQDSLRDNLRLADQGADDARLLRCSCGSGPCRLRRALPQGLDTRLGEGGFGTSGGQARRLALARLLLRGHAALAAGRTDRRSRRRHSARCAAAPSSADAAAAPSSSPRISGGRR